MLMSLLWLFNVVEGNIRFGMGAIKNVGKAAVEEMVRVREESGPFTSLPILLSE